jgi:uncharacterized membrane protein YesL
MKNIFSIDSPVVQKLSFFFDFMMINMIYILCCVPIVTIGAARAALFTCGNLWAEKDDAGMMAFLKAFFKNLKTATPVWIVMLLVGAFLAWDVFLLLNNTLPLEWLLWVVLVVVGFFYVVVSSQLFQMVAHYNCTVKQYIRNALLVGIAHPLYLVVNIGLAILPYIAFFYNFTAFIQLTLVWILGIFSFQGYLSGLMSKKFYKRITEQITGVSEEETEAVEA